jgi:hypothetical protein
VYKSTGPWVFQIDMHGVALPPLKTGKDGLWSERCGHADCRAITE